MNLFKKFIKKDLPSAYKFISDKHIDLDSMLQKIRVDFPEYTKSKKKYKNPMEMLEKSNEDFIFYKMMLKEPRTK